MKRFLISLIKFYQRLPLHTHSMCKFYPTCSNYMIDAINKYGCMKGVFLGIKRILRCNPFNKSYGIDLVNTEESNEKM